MPLDPQAEPLLEFLNAVPRDLSTITPEQLRAGHRALAAHRSGPEVAHVEDRRIPGPGGEIPVRGYRPFEEGPLPLLVYFHGGGFVAGGIDTHDASCRSLADAAGCVVLSVDYRLAPEARFPAAPEDCYAATCWAAENAIVLEAEPGRIAVGGDSAGGNLAAVVARLVRERGGPRLAHQLLVYPVTDQSPGASYPSHRENAEGYFLTLGMMHWFSGHYLERPEDGSSPLASPIRADDLSGLAPASVITAEFDPLRDEGAAYAERLRAAGVPLELRCYPGMFHGFFALTGILDRAKEAVDWAGTRLRAAFAARNR